MTQHATELFNHITQYAIVKQLDNMSNMDQQIRLAKDYLDAMESAHVHGKFNKMKENIGDLFIAMVILCSKLGVDPHRVLSESYSYVNERAGKQSMEVK
jgi:NTP pyrophosphatase (non-canonical NTP hydrolase)